MQILQVDSLPSIPSDSEVAVDIETTTQGKAGVKGISSDPYRDRIVSLQVSDGETAWILRNNFISAIPMLTNPTIKKLGHNFAFDIGFLKHHLGGIEIVNVYDTLMVERLLNSGLFGVQNSLADVLSRRLGVFKNTETRNQFGAHVGQFTEEQLKYMATDVLYLRKVKEQQVAEISRAGMGKVMALENALVPVIAQMELDGISLDRELWAEHTAWYETKKEEIKARICTYLDIPYMPSFFGGMEIGINLNSSDQVRQLLSSLLEIDIDKAGEAELLEAYNIISDREEPNYRKASRFIEDLLEWRGWEKLKGMAYHQYLNPITGHLHPNWNQLGAITGRFSCKGPNLQNVKARPSADEPKTREIFLPDEGDTLVVADFGQQEPRILAQVSGDKRMQAAAREDDMYAGVGKEVYNRVIGKKDSERQQIKTGILTHYYGGGYSKIARELGVSEDEAKAFQNRLDSAFPDAKLWGIRQVQSVFQRGYMTSLLGRRCWVKDAVGAPQDKSWHYKNQALNGPMQMTGADIGKEAMRRFYNWTIENGYREIYKIRMVIHDEIVVTCPTEDGEFVKYNLEQAMIGAMESICPDVKAVADADVTPRWVKV